MAIQFPSDALRRIFTEEVLTRLSQNRSTDEDLRVQVLNASGPAPESVAMARWLGRLRAKRGAWDTYVSAADEIGLLDADLESRLTSPNVDGFRAALAECMAAWVVAGRLRLPVQPRPPGCGSSVLEFAATFEGEPIHCEVKAPYRPPLRGFAMISGDTGALAKPIEIASKQFSKGRRNLLILVPSLMTPVERRTTVGAFLGEEVIQLKFDPVLGRAIGDPEIVFAAKGKMVKLYGRPLKPNFTRVSAVMVIQESGVIDAPIEPLITVVHNPYAVNPIPPEAFAGEPQLVRGQGEEMVWTDTGSSRVDG